MVLCQDYPEKIDIYLSIYNSNIYIVKYIFYVDNF